jgi:DNA-binding CsgD family transcriptional regulator
MEAALMRVVLVGPFADRRRLRMQLPPGVEVVAEYETAEDARASGVAADAVMAAPGIAAKPGAPTGEPAIGDAGVEQLTPREAQVLALLAEGLSNRGIAERLGISDQTVKFHVASVMGKLGTRNRVETVRLAVRRGLISL